MTGGGGSDKAISDGPLWRPARTGPDPRPSLAGSRRSQVWVAGSRVWWCRCAVRRGRGWAGSDASERLFHLVRRGERVVHDVRTALAVATQPLHRDFAEPQPVPRPTEARAATGQRDRCHTSATTPDLLGDRPLAPFVRRRRHRDHLGPGPFRPRRGDRRPSASRAGRSRTVARISRVTPMPPSMARRRPLAGRAARGLRKLRQSCCATSSASCTVLSAAPLRRLSFEMNSASPRPPSTPWSTRMRPT